MGALVLDPFYDPTFSQDTGFEMPWWFKLAAAVIGLFVLMMPILAVRAWRARKRVVAYVASQGWTYRDRDRALAKRWTGPPFDSGSNRRAESVIQGRYDGWSFVAFVHRYDSGSGQDETTWRTPVVALLTETSLPDLLVVREGGFGRALGKLRNDDIQLESEEFNRAFTVRCDDRRFASAVLNPRVMEQLLAYPRDSWALRNGDLLNLDTWSGEPADITRHLDQLLVVLRGVPAFVWHDHGGEPVANVEGVS
ncbi:MAG: DUF3137 domain-containing protein [Nocardioidaceae bacterium]